MLRKGSESTCTLHMRCVYGGGGGCEGVLLDAIYWIKLFLTDNISPDSLNE